MPSVAEAVPLRARLRLGERIEMAADDGATLLPGGAKPRALLALLGLTPDHRMPRRLLAGLLWSAAAQAQGLARLRDVLHDLRAGPLGGCLGADAVAVWLAPAVEVEHQPRPAGWPLLPELRGIDPALDDWLARAEPGAAEQHGAAEEALRPPRPGPRRPGVLVTPIASLTGPRAGGLEVEATDAIVAALSALRSVAVLVEVPGRPMAAADYVVGGNIHMAGGRPELALRLVDAAGGGAVLWSAILAPQEATPGAFAAEVAAMACARLEHELLLLEAERAAATPLAEAGALEAALRAVPEIFRLERTGFKRAGRLLAIAVRRDPRLAFAKAWLAYWNILLVGQGWALRPAAALAAAAAAAEQAVLLDSRDARALAVAGHVRGYLHHQVPEALALTRQALEINPALPAAWTFSGMAHAYGGELETARRQLRRALALLTRNPHAFFTEAGLATVEMLLGNHEAAIARGVLQIQPRFTATHRAMIASLGHLGRAEEAAPLVRALLALDPGFTLQRFRAASPYVRRRDLDHFLRGLRAGGGA